MSYDDRCEHLAGVFLMDAGPHINNRDNEVALAQVIQDAIEGFLREQEARESALGEAFRSGMDHAFTIVNRRSANRRASHTAVPPEGMSNRRVLHGGEGRRREDCDIPF
jgi:hypothetical protein